MADRPDPPPAPGVGQLLQIGATCGVCIGLGVAVGYLLDRVLGTTPLLVLLGLAVGIVGAATGSYYLIRPYLANTSIGARPK
ncbi:MAG TPA: AtpZ/AtpI family protein [Mycobacteriales bacterium]|nr:AtpZ/AtpI family protein [Mycobacteriales bacterium]